MEFSTYLFFDGQCAEAFKFYEQCLGGTVQAMTYAGSPMESSIPANWRDKIIHARLAIGDQILMGSDPPPDHYQKPQGFSVSISVKDVSEGERLFNCLSEGGTVQAPYGATFWAAGFGMCVDRFGSRGWLTAKQSDK